MTDQLPLFASPLDRWRFQAVLLTRRLLPRALVPAVVRARSWIGRRRAGRRDLTDRNLRVVLGQDAPQERVDRLAPAMSRHAAWRQEAYRRPELMNRQDVIGADHLRAVLSQGRGCVISFFHHGDYMGSPASLARLGLPTEMVSVSDCFDPGAAPNLKAATHLLTSVGDVTLLDVAGGSKLIRERLARGKAVMIAVDLAGRTPTRVFGREVSLSSGGLRLAIELDTPVLVMTSQASRRAGHAGTTVLSEPLYPGDFAGFEELHAAVVRQLEAAALAWPEAMHQPDRLFNAGVDRQRREGA